MIKVTLKFNCVIPSPYFELLMLMFEQCRQSPQLYSNTSIVRVDINTLDEYLNSNLIWASKELLLGFVKWCNDKKIISLNIETFGSNCIHLFFKDKQDALMFKLGDQRCMI